LVLNLILVCGAGLWVARGVVARLIRPRNPLQLMRASHFHELSQTTAGAEVVMVGDSLTQYAEWTELISRPAVNRGVADDTIEDVRTRLGDIVALRPKVLFLMIGVNDLERGATPPQVAERHATLVREIQAALPSTHVVVQSLLPVRAKRAGLQSAIAETNTFLARAAKVERVTWLDVGRALADTSGQLADRYTDDGMHLSGDGYRAWAETIRPLLP
jgi:lysophospholipase L1-like esterase